MGAERIDHTRKEERNKRTVRQGKNGGKQVRHQLMTSLEVSRDKAMASKLDMAGHGQVDKWLLRVDRSTEGAVRTSEGG